MAKGTKILSVRLSDGKAVMDSDKVDIWLKLNDRVIKWLKDNPIIKMSHICDESGLNQGNLVTSIKKGQISEENLEKIVKVISKLGFKR